MCSASGYYAWLRRSPSAREHADRSLRNRIVDIHSRSRGTYGAPRIHAELSFEGVCVGRKRVARLMRQAPYPGCSPPPQDSYYQAESRPGGGTRPGTKRVRS